jgi:hypothetical protein
MALLVGAVGCGGQLERVTVVFDESLDEYFSIRDPGFMGYSQAATLLRSAGYRVAANDEPLSRFVSRLQAPRSTALVITLRSGASFGREPLGAMRALLARGGAVVLLVEHDDIYGNAGAANELSREFGVEVVSGHADAVRDARLSPGPVTIARLDSPRLDSVLLYLAAPLSVTGPAASVLASAPSGTPVAARARAGRGRLLLVGDSEFLWNGTPDLGLAAGNNREFLLALVRLAVGSGAGGLFSRAGLLVERSPRGPLIAGYLDASEERFGDGPDEYGELLGELAKNGAGIVLTSDSRTLARADVVVLAEPLSYLHVALRHGQRVVAFANPVSAAAGGASGVIGPAPQVGVRIASRHPLAGVLEGAGVQIAVGVLRDSAGQFSVAGDPGVGGRGCVWRRAAPLLVADSGGAAVLEGSRASLDTRLMWPSPGAGVLRVRREKRHSRVWPLVVVSRTAFVLATGAPLRNAAAGTPCYERLVGLLADWISEGRPERTTAEVRR